MISCAVIPDRVTTQSGAKASPMSFWKKTKKALPPPSPTPLGQRLRVAALSRQCGPQHDRRNG